MNLKVKIRCDFGSVHGLGHFKRCLNLANQLKKKKIDSTFVINKDNKIQKILNFQNFQYITIKDKEISVNEDVSWNSKNDDFLIFDSRNITNKYLKKFKFGLICCFQDKIYKQLNCSILINNNIWVSDKSYPNLKDRKVLGGLKFNTVDKKIFLVKKKKKGLLITLGGEDPDNITLLLLKIIRKHYESKKIYIVLGPFHPNKNKVYSFAKSNLKNFEIVNSPKNINAYLKLCDLAITACGTTIYELMASKIYFGYFIIEDHQRTFVKYLKKYNLGYYIGHFKDKEIDIDFNLSKFFKSDSKNYFKNINYYINKSGLEKISNEIMNLRN